MWLLKTALLYCKTINHNILLTAAGILDKHVKHPVVQTARVPITVRLSFCMLDTVSCSWILASCCCKDHFSN